ncbi:neocarzinostatin apoprotein domain-containing protein [Streptodolium elevatio]|uniref:Neocarzinostatin apoprotein domain-containing protein n=1 Tax=Streptodolium elevatio TaxID=3157996 RepID=A0ABV3DIC5_9ACTN
MSTHRTRRRRAASLPVLLLGMLLGLPLALFAGAGTAHAENVSLSATKTTGLDPAGEVITVTGKGFKPGIKLFLTVCDPAQPAGRACDVVNFKLVDTDASGGFVADYKPAAKFGVTDCLATPCALQTSWVGNGKDRSQEGVAAIGFTGGVAPSLPNRPQENAGPPGATESPAAPGTDAAGAPSSGPAPTGIDGAMPNVPQTSTAPDASTAPSADKKDDDSDSSVWIVVGVVAAVVIVVGAGTFVFVRRRAAH